MIEELAKFEWDKFSWLVQISVAIFIGLVMHLLVSFFLPRKLVEDGDISITEIVTYSLRVPCKILIWIVIVTFILTTLIQTFELGSLRRVVEVFNVIAIIGIFTIFLLKLTRSISVRKLEKYALTEDALDTTLVKMVTNLVCLIILVLAIVITLHSIGFNMSGVIAAGGIGGLAIGLAAKDILANFFGAMFIFLDKPFKVGDWICSPDKEIEGTVEDIGWRVTLIRTFSSHPLYIPNSVFTTIGLENRSRMTNRQIYEMIGVRYDDASKVGEIVKDVKQMLIDNDDIDKDMTLLVNFEKFSESSLDIMIYCFTKTKAWAEYEDIKQDVFLKIIDIIQSHGGDCAFPTRTVHLHESPTQMLSKEAVADAS